VLATEAVWDWPSCPLSSSCILPCSEKVLPYDGFRVKEEDGKKGEEMDGRDREAGGES